MIKVRSKEREIREEEEQVEEQQKEKYKKSKHFNSFLCDVRWRWLTACYRCFGTASYPHIRERYVVPRRR